MADYSKLAGAGVNLAGALTKQPATPGAGGGGAQNYAAASGGLDAGTLFGGAKLSGSASAAGGGGGGGGGGGYSGAVADQRQILASQKSDNKNQLGANLDFSGNAGQRGANFNFGGTQSTSALGAGGGALTWIVVAIAGVLVLGIFLWRKK